MTRSSHAPTPDPRRTVPADDPHPPDNAGDTPFDVAPFDVATVALELAAVDRNGPELWLWEDTTRATVLAVELPEVDQTLLARTMAGATFAVAGPLPWAAVALVGTGWATTETERRRCSVTHVIDGTGRQACALGDLPPTPGAEPRLLVCENDRDAPSGRMTDALRRVVGLDTDPPPVTTSLFHGWAWERAVRQLVAERPDPSWEDVAACHPAHHWAREAGWAATDPEDLMDAAESYGEDVDWESVRHECAAGFRPEIPIDPDLADWCDDGMFARLFLEVADTYPELYTGPAPLLGPLAAVYLDVLQEISDRGWWDAPMC